MNGKKIDRKTKQVVDRGDKRTRSQRWIKTIAIEYQGRHSADKRCKNNDAQQRA